MASCRQRCAPHSWSADSIYLHLHIFAKKNKRQFGNSLSCGLSARRAQRTKSRGTKGLQPEVAPQRGPKLLVDIIIVAVVTAVTAVTVVVEWFSLQTSQIRSIAVPNRVVLKQRSVIHLQMWPLCISPYICTLPHFLAVGNKKKGKSMVFYHTPPVWSFSRKKFTPHFFFHK